MAKITVEAWALGCIGWDRMGTCSLSRAKRKY